jgi:hypothetical protein
MVGMGSTITFINLSAVQRACLCKVSSALIPLNLLAKKEEIAWYGYNTDQRSVIST